MSTVKAKSLLISNVILLVIACNLPRPTKIINSQASSTPTPTIEPARESSPTPTPTQIPHVYNFKSPPIQPAPIADLAVDEQNLYWLMVSSDPRDYHKDSVLIRMSKSRGYLVELAEMPGVFSSNLIMDAENLYWISGKWNVSEPQFSVLRVSKQGGEVYSLWRGDMQITGITLDETNLYWSACSSLSPGQIMKIPRGKTQTVSIIAEAGCPSSLYLIGDKLYFSDTGLMSVDKNGGAPVTILADANFQSRKWLSEMGIGIRDERSYTRLTSLLELHEDWMDLTLYVDNYPGMLSCTDQKTVLIRGNENGTYKVHASLPGRVMDSARSGTQIYLISDCSSQVTMINAQTGVVYPLETGGYPSAIAVDGTYLYWGDQNGGIQAIKLPVLP